MSVALNPRGVLCRAPAVSGHRRPQIPGVSNPPVVTGLRPGPCRGVAHAPLIVVAVSAEIARAKSFARHLEIADWNAVLIAL
jgi:hypothetical protein